MLEKHLRRFTQSTTRSRSPDSRVRRFASRHARLLRTLTALLGIALITSLFPLERSTEFSNWREGMVAPRDVIAPFRFYVRKGEVELEQERALRRVQVPPVLRIDPTIATEQEILVLSFVEARQGPEDVPEDTTQFPRDRLSEQTLQWLSEALENMELVREVIPPTMRQIYQHGVLSSEDIGRVREYFQRRRELSPRSEPTQPERVAVIQPDGTERLASFSKLRSLTDVRDDLSRLINASAYSRQIRLTPEALRALHNLVDAVLLPDLRYDPATTLGRQQEAAARVPLYKKTISEDERFIESHAVLSAEDIDELDSFRQAQLERRQQTYSWQPVIQWSGRLLAVVTVVLLWGWYFREFHSNIWARPSWLLLAVLLVFLPLTAAAYAAQNASVPVYMVPLALTPMLATVLFGPQPAFALAGATILLAGALLGFDYQVVFVNSVAAVVAVFAVRDVRNRNQFARAMIQLPVATVAAILAVDFMQATSPGAMLNHVWPGAVAGVIVPILSMGLLVVCEKLFDITTRLTLLELSDLNSPLLRELSIRAPGTYTHSIIIANLSEAGAEAIGADPLLARVGAYYHDIGKMQRPNHFAENQTGGRNPHDKLSPQMSTLVIGAHVKDGIEIAERVGLPKQIIDFIPEHQGTLLITYFYRKAQELYGENAVSEESFRYPGPRPRSKETAILMMADAVEAAVRSLRDKTPTRVKSVVHDLIRQRLDDAQFDDCDLTLKDLATVEEAFLPVLAGAMHGRIEYPKAPSAPQKKRRNAEDV